MYLKTIKIKNGNYLMNFSYFKCDDCDNELPENYPRFSCQPERDIDFCGDCAFKLGLISKEILFQKFYFSFSLRGKERVAFRNNEIFITDNKFDWEKTNSDYRKSLQYKNWREKVFQRDKFVCQRCKQKGGVLNAHHIKPFRTFKKLRFNIENGLTLCKHCHLLEHWGKCEDKNKQLAKIQSEKRYKINELVSS